MESNAALVLVVYLSIFKRAFAMLVYKYTGFKRHVQTCHQG